jgi:hypothetical protein
VAVIGADDAIFGLLAPFWQLVLGAFVLFFVAGAAVRLVGRGRSRMRTAIVVTGLAVIGLMAVGVLTSR